MSSGSSSSGATRRVRGDLIINNFVRYPCVALCVGYLGNAFGSDSPCLLLSIFFRIPGIVKDRWLHHTSFLWDFQARNMEYLKARYVCSACVCVCILGPVSNRATPHSFPHGDRHSPTHKHMINPYTYVHIDAGAPPRVPTGPAARVFSDATAGPHARPRPVRACGAVVCRW